MAQVGIRRTPSRYLAIGLIVFGCWGTAHAQPAGTLPSWHDGAARAAIVEFVEAVTAEGGADYVPPEERVAVFDNDGTLWVEQPYYTQLAFALDRIRALAQGHPEWREQQPFKAVLENDLEALKAAGIEGVAKLAARSTQSGERARSQTCRDRGGSCGRFTRRAGCLTPISPSRGRTKRLLRSCHLPRSAAAATGRSVPARLSLPQTVALRPSGRR